MSQTNSSIECGICRSKGHYQSENGLWYQCSCITEALLIDKFRKAGVPEEYLRTTLGDLLADSPEKMQTKMGMKPILKEIAEGSSKDYVFNGKVPDIKLMGFLCLKAALLNNDACYTQLDDLTTAFLTSDKASFKKVRDAKTVVLLFGQEYLQPVHTYLLNYMRSHRSERRFTTIWLTSKSKQSFTNEYKPDDKDYWLSQVSWVTIATGWNLR